MSYYVKRKSRGHDYFFEVEGYREDGKVKQRVLRYFGRKDPRKYPHIKPIVKHLVRSTYSFGDVALIFHCAKEIKLIETINKYMPKRQGLSHGLMLFLLAAQRLCDNKPSSERLGRWCESTFLPKFLDFRMKKINKNTISYTLDCITNQERNIDHTLRISQELYNTAHKKLGGKKEEIYFYDLTSTYFEGKCCPIARFGHNRDGLTDKLQINIGMIANKTFGLPLMTKVFEGNVNDGKTVYEMVYYAKFVMNKKKIMIIMDRGMDSEDNVRLIDTTGDDYILGMSSKHKFVSHLKNKTDPSTWKIKHLSGKKIKLKKFIKNIFGKRRILVMYYNEEMAMQEQEAREHSIACKIQELKDAKELTLEKAKEIVKGFGKYILLQESDDEVEWEIDQVAINQKERTDGKFCILTNKDLSAEDIFKLYFSKDKVEKGFRCMKQDLHLHPTRKTLSHRVRADVFVCHVGYLLLTLALKLVQKEKINIFWDSLSTEMKEVRLLEYEKCCDNFYYDCVANNRLQQNIVDKLHLNAYIPREKVLAKKGV